MAGLTGYLLDTNVISETVRSKPNAKVLKWLDALEPEQIHVSVLSLGEIRKGALMVAEARRRTKLLDWLDNSLSAWFEGRVLAIDEAVCASWAELLAAAGRPLAAIDSLLAATAVRHGLAIATRNVRDFDQCGAEVVNPWD